MPQVNYDEIPTYEEMPTTFGQDNPDLYPQHQRQATHHNETLEFSGTEAQVAAYNHILRPLIGLGLSALASTLIVGIIASCPPIGIIAIICLLFQKGKKQ